MEYMNIMNYKNQVCTSGFASFNLISDDFPSVLRSSRNALQAPSDCEQM